MAECDFAWIYCIVRRDDIKAGLIMEFIIYIVWNLEPCNSLLLRET